MLRYYAGSRNDCQNYVRYLLDLPNKQLSTTVEPRKPIAFLPYFDQQNQKIKFKANFKHWF